MRPPAGLTNVTKLTKLHASHMLLSMSSLSKNVSKTAADKSGGRAGERTSSRKHRAGATVTLKHLAGRAMKSSPKVVAEKVTATVEAQTAAATALMTGRGPARAVKSASAVYRRKVRANKRRLVRR